MNDIGRVHHVGLTVRDLAWAEGYDPHPLVAFRDVLVDRLTD